MILAPEINLNPVEFYWNSVDSVLMPNECIITLLLVAAKKMHWKMSVHQAFFYRKNCSVDKPTTDSNPNKKEQNLSNTKTFPFCFDTARRHINTFRK